MSMRYASQAIAALIPDRALRQHTFIYAALNLVLLLGFASAMWASQAPAPADLILHNGKIVTVDNAFSVAPAVAIRGNSIAAVGTNAAIMALSGPQTRVIDLRGRTVLPGLIDTHIHPHQYAVYHFAPEVAPEVSHPFLIDQDSVEGVLIDMKDKIERDLREDPDRPWLIYVLRRGRAELTSVEFGEQVTRDRLDGLAPDTPLIVFPQGYPAVVNSVGLTTLQESVPLSVLEAELDENGRPTGRLGAGSLINRLVPGARSALTGVRSGNWDRRENLPWKARVEGLAKAYKLELEEWVAAGVTTWLSKMTHEAYAAYSLLNSRGEMPNRLAAALDPVMVEDETASMLIANLIHGQTASPFMWVVGLNGSAGGTTISGTCASIPYRPRFPSMKWENPCSGFEPGSREYDEWFELVKQGYRIAEFHAHGDVTVDQLLSLIEKASKEAGLTIEEIREKKHMIDHCPLSPRTDQIEWAKRLGVEFTCGPKYIVEAPYMPYQPEHVAKLLVPMRSIIDAGLRPGFHTDGHTGTKHYFKYMEILQTRKDMNGKVWNAAEGISREEALRMATIWNAEIAFAEDKIGSIEPGKWADMIVIDRDYLSIPVDQIGTIQVQTTILDGKVVYQRP